MHDMENIITLKNITKTYDNCNNILNDFNLKVKAGDFLAVVGKSGSGKSTLLNILGALDSKYSGEYCFGNINMKLLKDEKLSRIRNRHFGFIYQSYNLLNGMSVLDNIILPCIYSEKAFNGALKDRVNEYMKELDLYNKKDQKAQYLSGGEKQRVAIARAIILEPDVIFADEPTGNLDHINSGIIYSILKKLNQKGKTIIMVTHNRSLIKDLKNIVYL